MDPLTEILILACVTLGFVAAMEGTIVSVLWLLVVPGTRRTKKFFDAFTMEEMDEFTVRTVAQAKEWLKEKREEETLKALSEIEFQGRNR
jgi:hypothetical protein